MNLHSLSNYQYELPQELIAQYPCTPRDHSRLMVVDTVSQNMTEMVFHELQDFLEPNDQLIFNNTKVIPARFIGKREGGGESEIFLTEINTDLTWKALAKPGRKLKPGSKVIFSNDFYCKILDVLPDGQRRIKFYSEKNLNSQFLKFGKIPLPTYIKREPENELDSKSYQTVYAEKPGAVAAPTAGLHFTKEMLENLNKKKIIQTYITLHVGLGTFKPVQSENIRDHDMHSEKFYISSNAAKQLNGATNRQICVGTTTCRTLESASNEQGIITPGEFETDIFIYPGYQFNYVKSLLTNFHLPGSTLLMLVCALGGYELMMEAYRKAVKEKFRFYSYGDAMLIL